MGKSDFLSPKAIANRIKSKGLQKLRWYCQMCQKQCRDEVSAGALGGPRFFGRPRPPSEEPQSRFGWGRGPSVGVSSCDSSDLVESQDVLG